MLTPRTMPVGKIKAKERVWITIWIHSVASCSYLSIAFKCSSIE